MNREQIRHLKSRIDEAYRTVNTYRLTSTPITPHERKLRKQLESIQKEVRAIDKKRHSSNEDLKEKLHKAVNKAREGVLFGDETRAVLAVKLFEEFCVGIRTKEVYQDNED